MGSLLGLGGSAGSSSVPTWSGAALGAGAGGLSIPMFASGTSSAPGVLAMVGEKGPELVNLPRGAQVFKPSSAENAGGSERPCCGHAGRCAGSSCRTCGLAAPPLRFAAWDRPKS
ncbi:hypothetical protein BSZ18_08775 [Bradyrhizobium canariense]|uniref:Uncharacterized protein n=1 Tax=Bradyrhizobium canariense TaxID=255045 RepID=A0A1X3EAT0_9BRAD|nr:hypothetical protein BST67_13885 [Bradyrhizobium canariense]OSI93841.1 hypothetical protein BSZ24_11615 [Bradyrhizobium canariense]OSJ06868.1 hypothetical protein BSZ16_08745 [Bradyrhizobium canariense]OSJ14690.1 hypothetical protein BSZ18_08775 [Bradyrhizobium canariense]